MIRLSKDPTNLEATLDTNEILFTGILRPQLNKNNSKSKLEFQNVKTELLIRGDI